MLALNLRNIIPHKCFTMDLILHLLNTYDLLDNHLQPYLSQMMKHALTQLSQSQVESWI